MSSSCHGKIAFNNGAARRTEAKIWESCWLQYSINWTFLCVYTFPKIGQVVGKSATLFFLPLTCVSKLIIVQHVPNENFAFENLRILRVFSKFDGGLDFFENVKKTEQLRAPFSSAIAEDQKNFFFRFWLFLTKILVTARPNFTQFLASVFPTTFI